MTICPEQVNAVLYNVTRVWQRGGWVGVDLFFVLSGFLISGLLFREHQKFGHISFKNFFIRRGLKIYPPFFFMILVTFVKMVVRREEIPLGKLTREILFVQNYGEGLWNHTWSLAIEEHFYILLPIVLILSLRSPHSDQRPFAWVPRTFAAVALICLVLRIATALLWPYHDRTHQFPTHLRVDSLLCGVVIGYFYHYRAATLSEVSRRFRRYFLPLGILCFVPPFAFAIESTPFLYTFGFGLLWIGGALLLVSVIPDEPKPSLPINALSFMGSRSYSIYLWHMPMAAWGIGTPMRFLFGGFNWYYYAASYLAGTILLGISMASIIEYPVLRVRDRLYPSRSRALETAGGEQLCES